MDRAARINRRADKDILDDKLEQWSDSASNMDDSEHVIRYEAMYEIGKGQIRDKYGSYGWF